jgi:hypothetical protein
LSSSDQFEFWQASIRVIEDAMALGQLPIAQTLGDCKRNFKSVVNELDEHECNENHRLIEIISTLVEQTEPTEMGGRIPNAVFRVVPAG